MQMEFEALRKTEFEVLRKMAFETLRKMEGRGGQKKSCRSSRGGLVCASVAGIDFARGAKALRKGGRLRTECEIERSQKQGLCAWARSEQIERVEG
jgi:hypothetical protein